jgi:tRNA pseudouridine13 synthase
LAQHFSPISLDCRRAWGGPVGEARIRALAQDFQVVEVPLVSPDGEGEHSWLWVQKRNSNTQWVARQLARFADVPLSAVSYAGLKDRHAVTEQYFSIHLAGRNDPDWSLLRHSDFKVLSATRHRRKLKTGALRGNRFRLHIRDSNADSRALQQRLERLRDGGFPNYFGEQRFGYEGHNLDEAARMMQQPKLRLARGKRGLYWSAVRSALFNRVLSARVEAGLWNTAMPGDALQLDGKSACFVSDGLDDETRRRLTALQLHPTGPLCGDGDPLCRGDARSFESAQLRGHEDWIAGLKRARLATGRRALRVVPRDMHWQQEAEEEWSLSFFLPAGSYATSLLAEAFEFIQRS